MIYNKDWYAQNFNDICGQFNKYTVIFLVTMDTQSRIVTLTTRYESQNKKNGDIIYELQNPNITRRSSNTRKPHKSKELFNNLVQLL